MTAPTMTHRLTAEFIGTFWLVFGGCGAAVFAANPAGDNSVGIGYLGVALTCTSEFDRTDPVNWKFLGWTPSVSVEARSEAAPLVWGKEWTGTCDEPVTLTADDGTTVTVQGTCDGTQLTLG